VPEEFSLNVTGVGLINPLGVGTEQNRKTILNVKSGIVHIRVQICKRGKGFCTGRLHRAKRREAHSPVSALEIIFQQFVTDRYVLKVFDVHLREN